MATQREYDPECIRWLTKAVRRAALAVKNGTRVLPPDKAHFQCPFRAHAEFQRYRHLLDEMDALPSNVWDAYFLAQTWSVCGKIPITILTTLEQLGNDMEEAWLMNHGKLRETDRGTNAVTRTPSNATPPPTGPASPCNKSTHPRPEETNSSLEAPGRPRKEIRTGTQEDGSSQWVPTSAQHTRSTSPINRNTQSRRELPEKAADSQRPTTTKQEQAAPLGASLNNCKILECTTADTRRDREIARHDLEVHRPCCCLLEQGAPCRIP